MSAVTCWASRWIDGWWQLDHSVHPAKMILLQDGQNLEHKKNKPSSLTSLMSSKIQGTLPDSSRHLALVQNHFGSVITRVTRDTIV